MKNILVWYMILTSMVMAETTKNKEEAIIELPGIIVVADKKSEALTTETSEEEQYNTPGAVSIIDSKVLDTAIKPGGMSDVLKYTPGIYTESRFGTSESKISIRGSGVINTTGGGINYLRDGIPLGLGDSFITSTDIYDTSMADEITVYRGGDALKYGSSNLGGAVNVISKTGRTFDKSRITYMGGSNNFNQAQIEHGGITSNKDIDYYGNFQYTGNDGYRDWSSEQIYRGFGNIGYRWNDKDETRIYVTVSRNQSQIPNSLPMYDVASSFKEQIGVVPAHLNGPTGPIVNTPLYGTTHFIQPGALGSNPMSAELTSQWQNVSRNLDLFRTDIKHTHEIDSDRKFFVTASYSGRDLNHPIPDVWNERFSIASGSANYQDTRQIFGHNNEFIIGTNFSWADTTGSIDCRSSISTCSDGSDPSMAKVGVQDRGNTTIGYTQNSVEFVKDWRLVTGLSGGYANRYKDLYVSAMTTGAYPYGPHQETASQDYSGISPKVGLLWDVSNTLQLFGNISRGWEPPNTTNFYLMQGGITPSLPNNCNGPNVVLSKSCIAQTPYDIVTLKSQTYTQYELGGRGQIKTKNAGKFKFDFAAYDSEVQDEILAQANPINPALTIATNSPHTRHLGTELLIQNDYHIGITTGDNLRTSITYNWIDFRFNNDPLYGNNILPGIPKNFGNAEMIYQHVSGWYAGPTMKLIDGYYSDFVNNSIYKVPAVALMGTRAGYNSGKGWQVFAEGRNLFNTQWISNVKATDTATASSLIYNPGYGAQIFAGASYDF